MKKNLLLASLSILFFISTHVAAQSVHIKVFDAQTAIFKKDWSSAESTLIEANSLYPNNPYVLYELAQVYENTNRSADALRIYEALMKVPTQSLKEYLVVVRSEDEVEVINLAQLTVEGQKRTQNALPQERPAPSPSATSAAAPMPTPAPIPEPVLAARSGPPAVEAKPITSSSTPVSVNESQDLIQTSLIQTLKKWVTAWVNKDMQTYFASYTPGFKGLASSNSAWMKQRTDAITTKKMIEVDLTSIQIAQLSSTSAKVSFKQAYKADSVKESIAKVLLMQKIGDGWLIERESTQK
jgi:hypothetical protein